MKTPKKCKFQKSATRRATKRAGRERLTEFRERREGMPEITRTKTSGTRTRPSGVKDARWGWREAACRQPSWKEEWEERKSGRLRTSVLSNLRLMRTKADEWESGKNLPTKKRTRWLRTRHPKTTIVPRTRCDRKKQRIKKCKIERYHASSYWWCQEDRTRNMYRHLNAVQQLKVQQGKSSRHFWLFFAFVLRDRITY